MRVRQISMIITCGLALNGLAMTSFAKHKQPMLDNAPTLVQTSPIQYGDVPIYIDALGSLTAEESVTISSEVDGRITHIYFANGQQVGKGMPIVKFNNSVEQANYNIAVSDLNLARITLSRLKLLPPGVESKQDLSVKQAAIDSDEAKVQLAQANLNQKTLTAPFDGYLSNFAFQVGDYVTAGTPIVTLDNNNTILVNFSVQQSLSDKLQNGQQIKFTSDAFPKKIFYGTVTYISPTVSPTTRTIAVQALFANKENLLSPGMFVHAQQQIGTTKHAMLIPDSAISADIKGYYVYRYINHHAIKTYITTATRQGDLVEVTSGLKDNDIIIISGVQKIEDGSPVSVQQQGQSSSPAPTSSQSNGA